MNFYKRHLGDYLKKTSHLSLLEHGVYTRLIDVYYSNEEPISDTKAARLIGARTKEEKQAVRDVLEEFFTLDGEYWHQSRCDEEIAAATTKGEDTESGENSKSGKALRQQRYRERRKAMFDALEQRGVTMPFNAPMDDLQDALLRVTATQPVMGEGITRDASTERNVTATISHKPDSISQTPDLEAAPGDSTVVGPEKQQSAAPTRIGEICQLLRRSGINTSPAHMQTHAWVSNPEATDDLITTAIAKARQNKPGGAIHANYLKPIIEDLLNPPEAKPKGGDDWAWKKSDEGISRKGREMNMFARGGESYRDFADRIDAEIQKRKGKVA